MARIHGRDGRLYAGIANAAASAEPIAFLNSWSINFSVDRTDVTAFEDSNRVKLAGLPDASGDFGGWYDTATSQMFQSAVDGEARKFYVYPTIDDTAEYFFGTATFDFSVSSGVNDAVSVSGSWDAASLVQKVSS